MRMGVIERMIERLKQHVAEALQQPDLSLRDMYQLAKILDVLVDLEVKVGGGEGELREFVERLMRKVALYEGDAILSRRKVEG